MARYTFLRDTQNVHVITRISNHKNIIQQCVYSEPRVETTNSIIAFVSEKACTCKMFEIREACMQKTYSIFDMKHFCDVIKLPLVVIAENDDIFFYRNKSQELK